MKSSREDIKKETELCSRYQIAVLGMLYLMVNMKKLEF